MSTGKVLGLYGSASQKIDELYVQAVYELGALIAKHGFGMVYGAGANGLMGAAAKGMKDNDGYIIGVTPHFMHKLEPVYEECTEIIETTTMAERKETMESRADAFVIVPGGIGTFDEFFQVMTLKDLGQHNKPIVLYNVNGYYDELNATIRAGFDKGFIRPSVMGYFHVCDTPERVLEIIENELRFEA